MYNYYAISFHLNLGRLQAELLHQSLDNEDEILLAIAGVKQVQCFSVFNHKSSQVSFICVSPVYTLKHILHIKLTYTAAIHTLLLVIRRQLT